MVETRGWLEEMCFKAVLLAQNAMTRTTLVLVMCGHWKSIKSMTFVRSSAHLAEPIKVLPLPKPAYSEISVVQTLTIVNVTT